MNFQICVDIIVLEVKNVYDIGFEFLSFVSNRLHVIENVLKLKCHILIRH